MRLLLQEIRKKGGFLAQIQNISEGLCGKLVSHSLDLSKPSCRQKGKHYSHTEGVRKIKQNRITEATDKQ